MGVNSPTHLLSTHPLPLLRFPDYDPAPRQPPRGIGELYQKSGRGVRVWLLKILRFGSFILHASCRAGHYKTPLPWQSPSQQSSIYSKAYTEVSDPFSLTLHFQGDPGFRCGISALRPTSLPVLRSYLKRRKTCPR